jgi:tRNA (cmo5U34)-methyltransferase
MLAGERERFKNDRTVSIIEHNLEDKLHHLGTFDIIDSNYAIHHANDECKKSLQTVVIDILEPNGIFCNLEHVSSPIKSLDNEYYVALGMTVADEGPSYKFINTVIQLQWLQEIVFTMSTVIGNGVSLHYRMGKKYSAP